MSKDTKKKPSSDKAATKHVFTFRGDSDKAVGVSVWYTEATKDNPESLHYSPGERSFESKQTKKLSYSRKMFMRNAKGHAEAILKAGEFMEEFAHDPAAGLEAGQAQKTNRTRQPSDTTDKPANGEAAPF